MEARYSPIWSEALKEAEWAFRVRCADLYGEGGQIEAAMNAAFDYLGTCLPLSVSRLAAVEQTLNEHGAPTHDKNGAKLNANGRLVDFIDARKSPATEEPYGRHKYPGAPGHNLDDPGDCFTSDCEYGCGCWAGPSRSGGPKGIDPFGGCPNAPWSAPSPAEVKAALYKEALEDVAGDYGCDLLEPADPSLPPNERDPCREEYPGDPSMWCMSCVASAALAAAQAVTQEAP